MSFNAMKLTELREAAEYFAVEYEGLKKAELLAALAEEGITYEMYVKFLKPEAADEVFDENPAPVVQERNTKDIGELVLVKMERANPMYQINGHTFTREHPFVAMSEKDADYVFESVTGFRMATPKEVQNYYN
jgi:hypothetical protein